MKIMSKVIGIFGIKNRIRTFELINITILSYHISINFNLN